MQEDSKNNDLMITTDARKLLGVSTVKMTQLIKEGYFTIHTDPLDRRIKLISRAEVEALLSARRKAA